VPVVNVIVAEPGLVVLFFFGGVKVQNIFVKAVTLLTLWLRLVMGLSARRLRAIG
jgi:hypothetical protein